MIAHTALELMTVLMTKPYVIFGTKLEISKEVVRQYFMPLEQEVVNSALVHIPKNIATYGVKYNHLQLGQEVKVQQLYNVHMK
jgi:hypothetical protein